MHVQRQIEGGLLGEIQSGSPPGRGGCARSELVISLDSIPGWPNK
jgi:hypothetical protein